MEIVVNGAPETHAGGTLVSQLLEAHQLQKQACAVEVNKELVPRRDHETRELEDGDRVEIVTLVGGG